MNIPPPIIFMRRIMSFCIGFALLFPTTSALAYRPKTVVSKPVARQLKPQEFKMDAFLKRQDEALKTPVVKDWKKDTLPLAGVRYEYPSNWTKSVLSDGVSFMRLKDDAHFAIKGTVGVIVLSAEVTKRDLSAAELKQVFKQRAQLDPETSVDDYYIRSYKEISLQETTFLGRPAIDVSYRTEIQSEAVTARTIMFTSNGKMVSLTLKSISDTFEENTAVYQHLLDSVVLLPKSTVKATSGSKSSDSRATRKRGTPTPRHR